MKRNKYIANLEKEKLRLRIQQLELEKQIRLDWNELKHDLTPRNFIANKLGGARNNKSEGNLFSEALNYGLSFLSHKFSERAGRGLETVLMKGIDKLTGKIKFRR
jgi:hypothetical protein